MWLTKMKVDWSYSEIGRKMANGQLLFCTLLYTHKIKYVLSTHNGRHDKVLVQKSITISVTFKHQVVTIIIYLSTNVPI